MRHKRSSCKAFFLLAVLVVIGAAAPVSAQDEPITMSAQVGFDGYFKQNEWTPVRVTISNSGPDVEGVVVIEQPSGSSGDKVQYQTPVLLPGQSRKTITLYVVVESYQSSMTIKLVDGNRTLASVKERVEMVSSQDYLYAVASGELVDLAFLESIAPSGANSSLAYIKTDDLPDESAAWTGLDLLILNDVDTGTFTPAQLKALADWIDTGGRLVATGGPNWRKTAAGIRDLLPVDIESSVTVYDLAGLSAPGAQLTHPLDEGPYLAAQAKATGDVLMEQDGLVLLAQRRIGQGTVDWLALDLALAPLRDWSGNEGLWKFIIDGMNSRSAWADPSINAWSAREGLRSMPSLALPSTLKMVFFLVIYIVLIGPVNYFVLHKIKRTELAWMTIPVIILVFSGLAYLTGFKQRGTEVVFNRLSLVYGSTQSDRARGQTIFGVFSPGRETLDVEFPEGVMARPLVIEGYGGGMSSENSAKVEQSGSTILRDVKVDVGAMRTFRAETILDTPSVDCQLGIAVSRQVRLVGSVTNHTSFILENAGILLGDNIFGLGDLEPGQTVPVDTVTGMGRAAAGWNLTKSGSSAYISSGPPFPNNLPVEKLVGGTNYWDNKDLNRRFQILQALLAGESNSSTPQTAVFFAWSEQSLWNIRSEGKESEIMDTVGYFLEVPLSFSAMDEELVIPPALTTWELLGNQWVGDFGPYDFYLANGWTSFEYRPWETFAQADIDELIVSLYDNSNNSALGMQTVTVSLWDWEQNEWIAVKDLTWGDNHIDVLDNLIGTNNAVRVKIENPTINGVSVSRLDVTYVSNTPPQGAEGDGS